MPAPSRPRRDNNAPRQQSHPEPIECMLASPHSRRCRQAYRIRMIDVMPPMMRSLPAMLKCRDVSELATDYMERALPWRQRLAVRLHLFLCDMCRAYIDQLRKTTALLRGRTLPGPPAEVEEILA